MESLCDGPAGSGTEILMLSEASMNDDDKGLTSDRRLMNMSNMLLVNQRHIVVSSMNEV